MDGKPNALAVLGKQRWRAWFISSRPIDEGLSISILCHDFLRASSLSVIFLSRSLFVLPVLLSSCMPHPRWTIWPFWNEWLTERSTIRTLLPLQILTAAHNGQIHQPLPPHWVDVDREVGLLIGTSVFVPMERDSHPEQGSHSEWAWTSLTNRKRSCSY